MRRRPGPARLRRRSAPHGGRPDRDGSGVMAAAARLKPAPDWRRADRRSTPSGRSSCDRHANGPTADGERSTRRTGRVLIYDRSIRAGLPVRHYARRLSCVDLSSSAFYPPSVFDGRACGHAEPEARSPRDVQGERAGEGTLGVAAAYIQVVIQRYTPDAERAALEGCARDRRVSGFPHCAAARPTSDTWSTARRDSPSDTHAKPRLAEAA